MNKNILIALGVVLVAVGGYFAYQNYYSIIPAEKGINDFIKNGYEEARVINVVGSEFAFSPSEIRVQKGETVKIVLTNGGKWPHDWVVDELDVRTPIISSGSTDVTFTANTAGTFEYYCSVGNHRAMGMKGNLIVE